MAKPNRDNVAAETPADGGEATPGPTSVPAGTEKVKRTRQPRKPSADGLTQGDLKMYDTILTDQITKGRKDDAVTDEQLEGWHETRKRVRGLITPTTGSEGGAQ